MEQPPKVPEKTSQPKRTISVTSNTYSVYDADGMKGPGARKRAIKYGSGKNAGVELDPQPSDSPEDPLNWSRTKKELVFLSICMAGSIVGVFKTIFVSVNGVLATQFSVSYMAAAAFTGIPMIIAAFSGLGATILAQMIGKRTIYLVSSIMMLAAALWNMDVMQNYGAFMSSRVFQAIGWGTFESLLAYSIQDIFFVHERGLRMNIFNVIVVGTTWGAPILGGHISQSKGGFADQIMWLNIAQSFSILLLIVATPETTFDRSSSSTQYPAVSSITTTVTTSTPTSSPLKTWAKTLRLMPYTAPFNAKSAVQTIRALAAPSTLLTFLLTMPIVASAYAVAQNVALIFSSMPVLLFPSRLGYIFVLPGVLAMLAYTFVALASGAFKVAPGPKSSTPSLNRTLGFAAAGSLVGITGLLAFGLYTVAQLTPTVTGTDTNFSVTLTGENLDLKVVSFLFGLLVAGATILNFAGSSHLASCTYDLSNSHQILQNIMAGLFIVGFPAWINSLEGLKSTVIAITVLQILLTSTVSAVMWIKGETFKSIDEKLLGVEKQSSNGRTLQRWTTNESFFDA